jgi:hypothetical protein
MKFQENHEAVEFNGLNRLRAYAVDAILLAPNINTIQKKENLGYEKIIYTKPK